MDITAKDFGKPHNFCVVVVVVVVVIHACVIYDSGALHVLLFFLSNFDDVGACIFLEKVSIETFNISFESTQYKQQYGAKITCTEVRGGGGGGGELW